MNPINPLNLNLWGLPLVSGAKTRSICAENPNGAPGGGAMAEVYPESAAANLGKGWKVRPCITLPPHSTTTLAEIDGPGILQHMWITVAPVAYRNTILRIYWDGEEEPSIETPLGDFFANAHGIRVNINSLPVAVNPSGGFNSYWPMPFRRSARVTIENQWRDAIDGFFYQFTYALDEVPDNAATLHAQWRRSTTLRERPDHVILDGVRGQGHYVGTVLSWTQMSDGWWGEGEIKFFLDGDGEYPTICGTGTEDYFGGAWCFGDTYSTAFLGYPLHHRNAGDVPKHGLYRWHVLDPIRFSEDMKVTIQALGWWPNGKYQPLADDIASLGLWYQMEPHAPFPMLPSIHERWAR